MESALFELFELNLHILGLLEHDVIEKKPYFHSNLNVLTSRNISSASYLKKNKNFKKSELLALVKFIVAISFITARYQDFTGHKSKMHALRSNSYRFTV